MKKILVAGATGYLGQFIVQELLDRGYPVKALVRDGGKMQPPLTKDLDLITGDITHQASIAGCCRDIDAVISTVGITRQKDGLSYMDVDYQANLNLLKEAQQAGVNKFIYVSVLNGQQFTNLAICRAKELFVEQLTGSGLEYCVIRPNGFFSDMAEFLTMAKRGRVFLFGKGQYRSNPIHGADLAKVCVDAIDQPDKELDVGGPETLSHEEIALTAFTVLNKTANISHIPEWMRKFTLFSLRALTRQTFYGPVEFFLTVMATDMVAPEYGTRTLKEFFSSLAKQDS